MEGTVRRIEIRAPREVVYEIALNVESYPDWAGGVRSVVVLEEDDGRRPVVVDFTVDAMVKEISYILDYDHGIEDGFGWTARPNDDIELLEGSYTFNDVDDDTTEVVYALRVEPSFKVPGFLRRQAEKQIVGTALRGLKKRAEEAI